MTSILGVQDAPRPEDLDLVRHINELSRLHSGETLHLDEDRAYYQSQKRPQALGVMIPQALRHLDAKIGWPRLGIKSVAERMDVEGFRMGGSEEADKRLWKWWQANNLDVESGLGHSDSMAMRRAYVTIGSPVLDDPMADPTVPLIRVESAEDMFAEIDPRTRQVTRAIRVIRSNGTASQVTVYLRNSTTVLVGDPHAPAGWKVTFHDPHNLGVVPVVPLTNREGIKDIYGVSDITPEVRSVTDAASRILMCMQGAAELMAIPQRVLFGAKEEELAAQADGSKWKAYLQSILAFEDSTGRVDQYSAADLRNFTESLDNLAKRAASYIGVPSAYLSLTTDNPASADAIRASEVRLIKMAERKCKLYGEAWEQVMRIAMLVMSPDRKLPAGAFEMETIWRDPATPTLAAKADAIVKLATAITPDGRPITPVEQAREDIGYTSTQRNKMAEWDRKARQSRLGDLLGPPQPPAFREPRRADE